MKTVIWYGWLFAAAGMTGLGLNAVLFDRNFLGLALVAIGLATWYAVFTLGKPVDEVKQNDDIREDT